MTLIIVLHSKQVKEQLNNKTRFSSEIVFVKTRGRRA